MANSTFSISNLKFIFAVSAFTMMSFSTLQPAQAQATEPPPAEAYKSTYSVICTAQNCPDVVGAIESKDGLCSATLVAANLVATNLHCLPEKLRTAGADCNADMQFILPASKNYAAEKIECGTIEAVADTSQNGQNLDAPDWALVRLKANSDRKLSSVFEGSPGAYTVRYASYPLIKNPLFAMAEVQKVECTTKEVGYAFPHTFHRSGALVYLTDCSSNIVHGNSGAGLFNERNEFVGVVSHLVKTQFQNINDAMIEGSPNGIATRAMCLPLRGSVATACMIPVTDPEFRAAAIAFSTLAAFVREAKVERAKAIQAASSSTIDRGTGLNYNPTPRPQRNLPMGIVQYKASSQATARKLIPILYPDVEFERAYDFLVRSQFVEAAQEMLEMAQYLLPQVPNCVYGGAVKETPVPVAMPYEVFSFRDWTLFPDPSGSLFLKTGDDLLLQTPMTKILMPAEVSRSSPGVYVLKTLGQAKEFQLNDNETTYLNSSCVKEQQEREITRGDAPFSRELITPSEYCQNIYKKQAFNIYVRSFSVELRNCPAEPGR